MSIINKIGRRKSSVARVYLKDGKGKITINKRDQKDYWRSRQNKYGSGERAQKLKYHIQTSGAVGGSINILTNAASSMALIPRHSWVSR